MLTERQKELEKFKGNSDPFMNPSAKRSGGGSEKQLEKELENKVNECNKLITTISFNERKAILR